MTSSRTALLVALVSILLVLVYERRYLLLYLFFCCGFFVVVFFGEVAAQSFFVVETLSNFSQFSSVDSTQYIRVLMIYYGAQLGLMFFPLGAGAGNFGGVLSADSPVYRLLGVSDMNFFQGLSGIYDSNLAALIGEYGYFFAILICVCCSMVCVCCSIVCVCCSMVCVCCSMVCVCCSMVCVCCSMVCVCCSMV